MTRRHLAPLPPAPLARHRGQHCRHGSLTGWSALASIRSRVADDFSRPRRTPLVLFPMASSDYTRPYSPKDAA